MTLAVLESEQLIGGGRALRRRGRPVSVTNDQQHGGGLLWGGGGGLPWQPASKLVARASSSGMHMESVFRL